MSEPGKARGSAAADAGAPEQCTFLICARAGRCEQPGNCLAGVIPVNPGYQPLYKAARLVADFDQRRDAGERGTEPSPLVDDAGAEVDPSRE